ncbi:Rrf2 family transcriptional regulator [uncultured Roseobacter sp.]|uniref:RrF2 family transcriptional regulator n=1 Tax=uncultured Roseobacter sp. TaxID=114847 RepID=UPI002610E925|nr:Rrf2 family transcriptional regulator [uncultured Roseobacter sp.]
MRLTNFSDISLRVLLFAAAHTDRLVTIDEMVSVFGTSRGQLMKVVHNLTTNGFLEPVRGRAGGLRLALAPREINLGKLLRHTENDFGVVECMRTGNQCVLTGDCRLPAVLTRAMDAFFAVLDAQTLADVELKAVDFLGK